MRSVIHKTSFILAIACLLGLVAGIAYELTTHRLPFEDYLSGLFCWAWIFGIVNYFTRTRKKNATTSASSPGSSPGPN